MLNLSKDSDDLLYTVSLLHGFYGCYTAELSLKSVQFYGPGSIEFIEQVEGCNCLIKLTCVACRPSNLLSVPSVLIPADLSQTRYT
jgi:hypothetical protein